MKTLIKKLIVKDKTTRLKEIRKAIARTQPTDKEITYLLMINEYLDHRILIQSQAKIRIENDIEKWLEGINEIKFDYYKYTILTYFNIVHEKSDTTFYAPGGMEIKYDVINIETTVEDVY